jgi:hypothetical protein
MLTYILGHLWLSALLTVLQQLALALLLVLACALRNTRRATPTRAPQAEAPFAPVPVPSFLYALAIVVVAQIAAVFVGLVIAVPLAILDANQMLRPEIVFPVLFLCGGLGLLVPPTIYSMMLPTTLRQAFGLFFFQIKIMVVIGILVALVALPVFLSRPPS